MFKSRRAADPIVAASLEAARTEGFEEGFAEGFRQAETESAEAEEGVNLAISEAVEEAVEQAEQAAAKVHLETLRALEDDHEKHLDHAREFAREEALSEEAGERGKLWARLVALQEETNILRAHSETDLLCAGSPDPFPDGDRAVGALFAEVKDELGRARAKFPGENVTFAALVEEVGELATALFSEPRDKVRAEAVQVAVMAMRVVLDGDHTFDGWRHAHDLDRLLDMHPPKPSRNFSSILADEAAFTRETGRPASAAQDAEDTSTREAVRAAIAEDDRSARMFSRAGVEEFAKDLIALLRSCPKGRGL